MAGESHENRKSVEESSNGECMQKFWSDWSITQKKKKTRLGSDLCQCWQTHCARDKTVSHQQFIKKKRVGQDYPFWMWYLVTLFVRLYGHWLWTCISVLFMFADRTPGTTIIRTGINEPIIKRRTSARTSKKTSLLSVSCCAGRNRQLLPVYGMGTRLRNVTSQKVMSRNRLCIPGTNVSMPSQPLLSVETA